MWGLVLGRATARRGAAWCPPLYSELPDELAEVAPVQRGRVCQLKNPNGCREILVVSSDGSALLLSPLLQYQS
eukprot:7787474-Pyramimonas_sp.AAC.1